jgi:hypothetical protein
MNWVQAAVSVASALAGGFVGGCVVAFRLGRWRQRVEDRLSGFQTRLRDGDRLLGIVPVINTRLEVVLEEIRSLKSAMREDRAHCVTHEECDRRHGVERAG